MLTETIIAIVATLASPLSLPGATEAFSRTSQPRGELSEAERATITMFDRTAPSVVQVVVRSSSVSPFTEEESRRASGTGFIWDEDGHIVTNDHVVQAAEAVAVRFASGDVIQAKVVGLAPNYELAVLKIMGTRQLPSPIPLGSSADLKVGQSAFAIGNPFGLDQSLTSGIISALKRRLPTMGGREVANVIQTDAAVNVPEETASALVEADSAARFFNAYIRGKFVCGEGSGRRN